MPTRFLTPLAAMCRPDKVHLRVGLGCFTPCDNRPLMPRQVIGSILVAFGLSRALIFAVWILGSQISFLSHDYGGTIWRTQIDISADRIGPELTRIVMAGDAWWYRRIALEGYEPRASVQAKNTWAFFPLFPLVVRSVEKPFGFAAGAMLVSNASLLGSLFLFAALLLRLGSSTDEIERTVFYLCFFPTSYFFSLPMTEALFLLLSTAAFLAAAKRVWWAAGLAGALAAATRVVGLLLLPALVLLPMQRRERFAAGQLWLLLIPSGLVAFMLYLHAQTGDALAFVHAQVLWSRTGLDAYAAAPSSAQGLVVSKPWNALWLNAGAALLLVATTVACFRKREWAFAIYTAGLCALPLASGSLQSIARYSLVAFPMFVWLASVNDKRLERPLIATFVFLLGWLVALFTLRIDFALA